MSVTTFSGKSSSCHVTSLLFYPWLRISSTVVRVPPASFAPGDRCIIRRNMEYSSPQLNRVRLLESQIRLQSSRVPIGNDVLRRRRLRWSSVMWWLRRRARGSRCKTLDGTSWWWIAIADWSVGVTRIAHRSGSTRAWLLLRLLLRLLWSCRIHRPGCVRLRHRESRLCR